MTTTNTPGPWINQTSSVLYEHKIMSADRKKIIAVVGWTNGRFSPDNNLEMEANAALIAAAPDLLTALKRLEPLFDASLKSDIVKKALKSYEVEGFEAMESALRAAIAKAEGR